MRFEDLFVGQTLRWPTTDKGVIYTVLEVFPDARVRVSYAGPRPGDYRELKGSFSAESAHSATREIEEEEL